MDWSTILTGSNIAFLIAAIFAVIVAAVAVQYKELVDEVGQFLAAYAKAKCETSPGGKKITAEERELLIEKAAVILKKVFETFNHGFMAKLGAFFKGLAGFFKRVF